MHCKFIYQVGQKTLKQSLIISLIVDSKSFDIGTPARLFDARAILEIKENIKFNFIVNNIFNKEYVSRPADIQPPRTFIVQLQLNI